MYFGGPTETKHTLNYCYQQSEGVMVLRFTACHGTPFQALVPNLISHATLKRLQSLCGTPTSS